VVRTDSALLARILAAVVFLPILAWLIHSGGGWWIGYVGLLLSLALVEFLRMGPRPVPPLPCALALLAVLGPMLAGPALCRLAPPVLTPLAVLVLLAAVAMWARGRAPSPSARTVLGVVYVGWLGYSMLGLRLSEGLGCTGAQATALAHVLTWTSDTGAYATGMTVGRRPMAPGISPGKTWEGALGGLLACVLVGAVTGATVWRFLGPGPGALLGALVGVVGQAGDLLESMFKRQFGAKDSARWIPGHGGVLDRYDSLLATTPVIWLFLACLARR
jgi:phosphatidate cytidylyltransferase